MLDAERYCSYCGQKRIGKHDRSVWHLFVDSVGDFFHLDSKFFATLRPLIFSPGKLSLEYLAGRRARYFHPFKLFLFLSFFAFLASGLIDHIRHDESEDIRLFTVKKSGEKTTEEKNQLDLSLGEAYDSIVGLPVDSLKAEISKFGLNGFVAKKFPDASFVTKFLLKKMMLNRLKGDGTLRENLGKTIPKLIFILIPLFALWLKLLYVRRRIPYFDHIVFTLHFLSFFFLLFALADLFEFVLEKATFFAAIILLVYFFLAMRRFYSGRRWGTVWRYPVFLLLSMISILIFTILATVISFAMI